MNAMQSNRKNHRNLDLERKGVQKIQVTVKKGWRGN